MTCRIHAKFTRSVFAVFALSIVRIANSACAQRNEPMPVEEALRVREFGEHMPIAFSPDGKWLAFTVGDNQKRKITAQGMYYRSGIPSAGVGADVCVSNTTTLEAQCLGDGKNDSWLPAWSPDGHRLAFISDRDDSGQARLWVWETDKNNVRKISEVNVRGDEIQWTPDSRYVLVTTMPQDLSVEEYVGKVSLGSAGSKSTEAKGSGSTVTFYQSNHVSSTDQKAPKSDPWNLDVFFRDLALVDVTTGKAKVIVHGQRIAKYSLSPNGLHVAYTTPKRFERAGSQQILFDLATIELDTNSQRVIAPDVRLGHDGAQFNWSPDSTRVSFQITVVSKGGGDIYVADL